MSATLSEATGRPYGIQRVCQAWERSRSALYARQTREQQRHKGAEPARRGPTPTVSDATLLEAIQADLDRSPFQGEGHRKVHARLRILDGLRVARTRVLRVMRAHKLLSPHRGRQGAARVHAGTIVTQAPNVMWGTDGVRVFTLDDGWGWIFTAVEHWNAECVGWHVCKVGSRFAALEPIAQGLRRIYGALDADSARGLALRMDHGSQYLSDHFLNQIRYWGIRPSYGFVEEPETNGVAERWNRTLKEQAIHGRIFQNLKEVRAAVTAFVERYNTTWRLEKLGYHTPIEAREAHELRRPPIAPRLHENVEDVAVLVHGTPQILLLPLDLHEELVQIPGVALAAPAAAQPPCVVEPERPAPQPDRLIRHGDTPFGKEIFDISETQAETVVEPDGVTDDF